MQIHSNENQISLRHRMLYMQIEQGLLKQRIIEKVPHYVRDAI